MLLIISTLYTINRIPNQPIMANKGKYKSQTDSSYRTVTPNRWRCALWVAWNCTTFTLSGVSLHCWKLKRFNENFMVNLYKYYFLFKRCSSTWMRFIHHHSNKTNQLDCYIHTHFIRYRRWLIDYQGTKAIFANSNLIIPYRFM